MIFTSYKQIEYTSIYQYRLSNTLENSYPDSAKSANKHISISYIILFIRSPSNLKNKLNTATKKDTLSNSKWTKLAKIVSSIHRVSSIFEIMYYTPSDLLHRSFKRLMSFVHYFLLFGLFNILVTF